MLILVQGSATPSEAEWTECLDILGPFVETARALVVTQGGGPNPSQRAQLSALIGGRPIRVAIVTDSAKVRFIVASVALFIRHIRCFTPVDMNAAFVHLDMSLAEKEMVRREIEDMRQHVGVSVSGASGKRVTAA